MIISSKLNFKKKIYYRKKVASKNVEYNGVLYLQLSLNRCGSFDGVGSFIITNPRNKKLKIPQN